MQYDPPHLAQNLDNVRAAYALSDETDRNEGLQAYPRYQKTMQNIAGHYGFSLIQVAGAFAALSPNNDYSGNLRSLCSALHGYREGWDEKEVSVTTYGPNRHKAWRILQGEHPLVVIQGEKTRNFFVNICDPLNGYAVTVDGHMVGVWRAKRIRMSEAGLKKGEYHVLADGFRYVAGELHLLPCVLQACLWFVQKRVHRVLYDPQMNLFDATDHWRLERTIGEVGRYKRGHFTQVKVPGPWRRDPKLRAKVPGLSAENADEDGTGLFHVSVRAA